MTISCQLKIWAFHARQSHTVATSLGELQRDSRLQALNSEHFEMPFVLFYS